MSAAAAVSAEKSEAPIDVRAEGERGATTRGARDPGVASYVIRGDGLKRPGATAVDAIAASPGVQGARSGAGSDLATVSIRGAPSAELPVYLAGIRLNDDVTGGADLSTVPLFMLDRVEVYRGNAPADADRLGIGGAIFFEPKLPRGTRVEATFGAGSFGELGFGAAGSIGDERGGALFSFSRQSATNDFTYTDGRRTQTPDDDRVVRRANGDATTHDAWALGRVALPGGGRLVLLANTFAREQGVVGTTFFPATEVRSATRREIAGVSARLPCTGGRSEEGVESAGREGSGSGLAGGNARREGRRGIERCAIELGSSVVAAGRAIDDPLNELGAARVKTAGERWQETARVRAWIAEHLEIGAAAFVGLDRLGIDVNGSAQTRAARLSVTGSASVSWEATERLTLFALGGGECHTAIGGGGAAGGGGETCGSGGPIGRVGARFLTPLGIELVASGGSYVRVPTLGELYGLSATVTGNGKLVPERGQSAEIGARFARASDDGAVSAYADVTGFARWVDELIVYRLTGPGTVKPFNIGSARVLGVEGLAGLDLLRHVRAEVSLTATDPRDVTSGRKERNDLLPYHAPLVLSSTLELYAKPASAAFPLSRAALAARWLYRAPRYADDAGVAYLAEQRDLGFDASALFWGGRLGARFSVTNALDVTNEDLLGFALPGRAFHGSVEASWW